MSDRAHRASDAPSPGGATDGQRQGAHTAENAAMRARAEAAAFGEFVYPGWSPTAKALARDVLALLARVEAADKRAAEYACKVLEQLTELEDSQEQAAVLGERVVALETEGARLRRALEAILHVGLNGTVCTPPNTHSDPFMGGDGSGHLFDIEALNCPECKRAWRLIESALAQSEGLPPPPSGHTRQGGCVSKVLRVIRRCAYVALIVALAVVAFIVWVPLGLLFGFGDEADD